MPGHPRSARPYLQVVLALFAAHLMRVTFFLIFFMYFPLGNAMLRI